jgi:hypothetical protein
VEKRQWTSCETVDSAVRLVEVLALHEETPSRWAIRGEAARALQVALTMLQPRQRQAVTPVWIEGRSHDEAARAMRTTKEVVRSLIYRGLEGLREQLGSLSQYLSRHSASSWPRAPPGERGPACIPQDTSALPQVQGDRVKPPPPAGGRPGCAGGTVRLDWS